MAKFLLVAGRHVKDSVNPMDKTKYHEQGEVVESSLALDRMFANKFRRVNEDEAKTLTKKSEKIAAKKKAKAKEDSDEEDEDDTDLHEVEKETEDAADESGFDNEGEDEPDEGAAATSFGSDVTAKLPPAIAKKAKEKGLLVFENKKEKFFSVFDEDKREEPIKTNITDKKAVVEFIKTYEGF